MARTVFYSWQSDRISATNRGFILTALKAACLELGEDPTIDERHEVDHDTQGLSGAPDIAQSIFAKIDTAEVFVADVTIVVGGKRSRSCPNPNVLIELGYAVKTMGWNRIILIFNTAYGKVEALPFDLKMKRATTYRAAEEETERAPERKKLQSVLRESLRAIFAASSSLQAIQKIELPSPGDIAQKSIEDQSPKAPSLIRAFGTWLVSQIDDVVADTTVTRDDELFVQALDRTIPFLISFVRIAETIASHDARTEGMALFKSFEKILARYELSSKNSGGAYETDFDLARFVGEEAFVSFIALLIRENRWELIADLLGEDLIVETARGTHTRSFNRLSAQVRLLENRNARLRLNRLSLHADILKERHETGGLSKLVPFSEFIAADFFLFVRSELQFGTEAFNPWYPRTAVHLDDAPTPRYFLESRVRASADKLAVAFGVADAVALRTALVQVKPRISQILRSTSPWMDDPLKGFDPSSIGSR